jgi:hypothetical protein
LKLNDSTQKYELKKKHNYFYQVQGQLAITGRDYCDFILLTNDGDLFIQRIDRDRAFWNAIEPVLVEFYKECLLPEMIDPRHERGEQIREPKSVRDAQAQK